jgi:hypothetical protein
MNIGRRMFIFAFAMHFAVSVTSCARQRDLKVMGRRPVALAVEMIGKRHGVMISYEDPIYRKESNLEVVYLKSRAASTRSYLVPAVRRVELMYKVLPSGAIANPVELIRQIALSEKAAPAQGAFTWIVSNGMPIIVPVGEQRSRSQYPMDKRITLETRDRNGIELLWAIATAGGNCFGTAPYNELFARHAKYGAVNQPLRDVLTGALKSLGYNHGSEADIAFDEFYDPNLQKVFIRLRRSAPPAPLLCECDGSSATTVPECKNYSCDGKCPTKEEIAFNGFRVDDWARFDVNLKPAGSFSGRAVREFTQLTTDTCDPPNMSVFGDDDFPFPLDNGDHYQDYIGMGCDMIQTYGPCTIEMEQRMGIDSGGNVYCRYQTNTLQIAVTAKDVSISRGTAVSVRTAP